MSSGERDPRTRKRLAQLMNERRRALRLTWDEVAHRAGIHRETLRAIRRGQGAMRELTKAGIDDALQWEQGKGVEAILSGKDPVAAKPPADTGGPPPPADTDLPDWLTRDEELMRQFERMTPEEQAYHLRIVDEMIRRSEQRMEEDVKSYISGAIIRPTS